MSNRIKLETYTLRIRAGRQKEAYECLDGFFNGQSLLGFWADFLDHLKSEMTVDNQQQRTLHTVEDHGIHTVNQTMGFISGVLESGVFGVASKGKNIDTGDLTYKKTIRDADVMPYFYMIYMPPKSKFGALVLQRFGNHGISSIIRKKLSAIFSIKYPGYRLDINDLVPIEVIKEYIKSGEVSELIFKKNQLPPAVEDYMSSRNLYVRETKIHFKLTDNNPLANKELLKWLDSGDALFVEVPGFKELGFDTYKLSVMIKKGGTPREIDFSDTMKMRPYFDIHDEVEKDISTNYPEINSIYSIAKTLILDIFAKEIQFKNGT